MTVTFLVQVKLADGAPAHLDEYLEQVINNALCNVPMVDGAAVEAIDAESGDIIQCLKRRVDDLDSQIDSLEGRRHKPRSTRDILESAAVWVAVAMILFALGWLIRA